MATISTKPTLIERRWTIAEYLRLPEGPPYYEFEDGRLTEWPLRSGRHQRIVGKMCGVLSTYLDTNPIGDIWPGVLVCLTPARVYIPDLSFLLTANLERFADDVMIQGPPDLVVEVVSPSTAARDRSQKLRTYHRAGVPWYWLVEGDTLLITEYRHTLEGYLVNQIVPPEEAFAPAIFPGLSLRMADWFGEPTPKEETNE
jgi:Uma2 family endonuclease